ncbi:MAG TPA: helix-hairpin-helix domain-containing protein [Phycisphaerae bacterium]|nr:helix-hairpin-helix domain-containing protein [Phycisphaerae bacterium]
MTRSAAARYDFRLRRISFAGLIVLCAAAWAALALRAMHRSAWEDRAGAAWKQRADAAEEKIDPNTAPAASLRRLPGIGAELAARIVDFRSEGKRPFGAAKDLAQVRGIAEAKVERIDPYLDLPASTK